jgi:MFS transporter, DHA2 family, multidrug resistance protein
MASRAGQTPAVSPWVVAISVMSATFMVVLDTTVVNVSLPHIAGSLSATVEESTWALTSYLAANAVILPLAGWLANYFGRRRLLLISVTGFTTASLLCGLSPSLPVLIVWRVIQGMTGGVMQPLSQAIMLEAFAPEDRGKAMGFWGVGIVVAPILGPVLGGWLTDAYTWRLVFLINLPVGLLALVMIRTFIFDPPYIRRGAGGVDIWGIALLGLGVGALQIALDRGEELDWLESDLITVLFVVAAVTLVAFVIYGLRARHPVVDLHIFKERTYTGGVVLITMVGFCLYGSLVLLPILLETLLGYSPLAAGIAMSPRGIGSLIAMPIIGILTVKVDPRKLLGLGLIGGATALFWLGAQNLNSGTWDVVWPQFVQGIATGLLFVPLTTITMDPIPNHAMGNATSLFNLTRNIGGSVGIAITQTMIARGRQTYGALLGSHVTPYHLGVHRMLEQLTAAFAARGADPVTAGRQALAALYGMLQRQASMMAFVHSFRFLGLMFVIFSPFIFLMHRPRTRVRAVPEVE